LQKGKRFMKPKFIIAFIIVAFIAFFLQQKRGETPSAETSTTNAATASTSAPKLGASSVLNIDPKVSSAPRAQLVAPKTTMSADMQLFRDKKDWPLIYQRAKNGPQTGEALYLQAELLDNCAKRPPDDAKKVEYTREIKREKFIQTLSGKEEQKAVRIAAYDTLNVDACGELRSIEYSKDEVTRLSKAAAEAGDPRARAWRLQVDIAKASSDDYNARNNIKAETGDKAQQRMDGYLISDQQWAAARELLAKGDPAVLADLRSLLSSTLSEASIRIGPDKDPIENRAFHSAWTLVGCDMGNNCGASNPQLLSDCAYRNRCGSTSLQDQTYFFEVSPHEAQLVERYRQTILEAIRTGDFTNLDLVRGPQTSGSTFMFGNRRP
jgi:hypothetical protein